MKNKILSIIAIGATLLTYSCKGPEGTVGPAGPTGSAGATGATGATGSTGANGTAKAVYSEWKALSIDKIVMFNKNTRGDYTALTLSPLDAKEPLFTKEAINTAAIYTYVKYNIPVQNGQTFNLEERVKLLTNSNVTSYYFIPGRDKTKLASYAINLLYDTEYGENYFNYTAGFIFDEFPPNLLSRVLIPEFQGKDLAYFQNSVKTTTQIRHVVVYGSIKGRMTSINMNDYEEVKSVFNLKD
jgi:hypothetical protein